MPISGIVTVPRIGPSTGKDNVSSFPFKTASPETPEPDNGCGRGATRSKALRKLPLLPADGAFPIAIRISSSSRISSCVRSPLLDIRYRARSAISILIAGLEACGSILASLWREFSSSNCCWVWRNSNSRTWVRNSANSTFSIANSSNSQPQSAHLTVALSGFLCHPGCIFKQCGQVFDALRSSDIGKSPIISLSSKWRSLSAICWTACLIASGSISSSLVCVDAISIRLVV